MSSSQLTFSPSFFRGVGLNHQPDYHLMGFLPINECFFYQPQWECLAQHGEKKTTQKDLKVKSDTRIMVKGVSWCFSVFWGL